MIGHQPAIIQSILDFDYLAGREPSIIVLIATNRRAEKYFFGEKEMLIPCYPSIDQLPLADRKKVNWMLNLQSGRRAYETTGAFFAAFPKALGGHIFAENVPERQATDLIKRFGDKYFLIGPAGVGLLVPGSLKLGAIGGITPTQLAAAHAGTPGNIAIGSTSGGMTNELIHAVSEAGKRISFAACVGGDRFPVVSLTKLFTMAEEDKQTKTFVYFGELGGVDEYEIVELIKSKKFTKPLVAYIAGVIDEAFTDHVQFGHAKALVQTQNESARAKRDALRAVGVTAPETFPAFLKALKKLPAPPKKDPEMNSESLMHREKSLLSTRKINPDPSVSFTENILTALLGRKPKSRITTTFTGKVFSLLIDHGGHVSGAVNTMITARAGKDLVSSLAAGLLTIGPRFGGAVNAAAAAWLRAVEEGVPPREFVETETKAGRLVSGIGHKKYRGGLPDPRLRELRTFADQLKKHPHLDFAEGVEKVTTGKNGSLILNVDGAIAALLLDILAEAEGLKHKELVTLIESEFFNAFFVIPRTVGFIAHFLEQKQNDEGLFRLPDNLLFERED